MSECEVSQPVLRLSFFFCKRKTAYDMRISDWSSDVCSSDLNLGTGVQLSGTSRIDTQGTFATTGNALDVAIDGAGFFQVDLPDGRIGYTRAGNFERAPDGTIVTPDGKPLIPQIQVPEDATGLSIGVDGTVSATVPGQADVVELGRIEIARFANPSGLQAKIGRAH